MIRRAPEWCPWCRGMADDAGARVTLLNPNRGAGGCVVTPWDGGGWECSTCGARAPRQAWAQAQRWQASSDVMRDRERQRANAAEAEVATARALADALRADNERLRAIVAGSQRVTEALAAYLSADKAYDAARSNSEPRVRVEPADREARREILRTAALATLDAEAAAKTAIVDLVGALAGTAAAEWVRYRLDYDGTGP